MNLRPSSVDRNGFGSSLSQAFNGLKVVSAGVRQPLRDALLAVCGGEIRVDSKSFRRNSLDWISCRVRPSVETLLGICRAFKRKASDLLASIDF